MSQRKPTRSLDFLRWFRNRNKESSRVGNGEEHKMERRRSIAVKVKLNRVSVNTEQQCGKDL